MNVRSMRSYEEKRNFMRIKVDSTIQLTDSNNGHQYHGNCLNLSSTGMSVEVNQYIPANTELSSTLPSNHDAFSSFDTTVRVIRCTELGNNKYLMGAEILKIM